MLLRKGAMMEYEYKVIDVADGSISSILLGEGRIETKVLRRRQRIKVCTHESAT